jgi:hypothetical protein
LGFFINNERYSSQNLSIRQETPVQLPWFRSAALHVAPLKYKS